MPKGHIAKVFLALNCCLLMFYLTKVTIHKPAQEGQETFSGDRPFEDVPLVEFMYLVFTCMLGELPQETQVFVVVLVLRISSAG